MGDISLSKAVRSNLLSLQNTSSMMAKTQDRLASGNKVNSALDNPTNFFTAQSLNSRAGDLNSLMDGMMNGIQTLEAADNGLTSITKNLESMQSTLRQARQDKSFQTASYTVPTTGSAAGDKLSFTKGAVGTTAVDINLTKGTAGSQAGAGTFATMNFDEAADKLNFSVNVDGTGATAISIGQSDVAAAGNGDNIIDSVDELATIVNAKLTAAGKDAVASNASGKLKISSEKLGVGSSIAITGVAVVNGTTNALATTNSGLDTLGTAAAGAADGGAIKTVDELVSEINTTDALSSKVRASNDNGKLRIENLSTESLEIAGTSTSAVTGDSSDKAKIGGNTVRADLADQFNELRDQLDKLSDDASFNGINLLRGDKLTITFNETGTSSIDIQTKGEDQINAANLGVFDIKAIDLDSDANIDAQLAKLKTALNDVRSQSSAFGSNLSIVQNRQDFTKSMINTLQTGGANLTLADMNEEAANLLALQTRQSLSSSSLSLASQADQSVLQLIR